MTKNVNKSYKNVYEDLKDNINDAMIRAKKQYEKYGKSTPPSKMCPATKVWQLVQELMQHL